MAGVFYARYVPPPAVHRTEESSPSLLEASGVHESEPKRSRKRKRSSLVKDDGKPDGLKSEWDPDVKPQPPSESPTDGTPLGTDEDGGALAEGTKHSKIKAKFTKSQNVSAEVRSQLEVPEVSGTVDAQYSSEQKGPEPIHAEGLTPIPQPRETAPPPVPSALEALPKWIKQPTVVSPKLLVPFSELQLSDSTLQSLRAKGFENAFAIQASVIPMLLDGTKVYTGDICMSAATGSGKTLAYTLPIVEALKNKPVGRLRALVIVPTRELVVQVQESFQASMIGTRLVVGTAVGNRTIKEERKALISRVQRYDPKAYKELRKPPANDDCIMEWPSPYPDSDDELDTDRGFVRDYESKADILICTPGRLVEHMRYTKGFTLHHIQWLVVDEADKLLDNSFQQWIARVMPALEYTAPEDPEYERVLQYLGCCRPRRVKKIILSATMTRDISKLVPLKLWFPRLVAMGQELDSLTGGLDPEKGVGRDHASLTVPSTLSEAAISILGVEHKPLYLLRLLTMDPKSLLEQKGSRRTSRTKRNRISASAASSTSPSSSDSESSLDSASTSDSSISAQPSSREPLPKIPSTLIFTHSSESALRLSRLLSLLDPTLKPLLHTLTKSKPSSHLRTLLRSLSKKPHTPLIIVASDRASRGLDIHGLAQVINYDMPTSATTYVHRVGRTARAGKYGRAITLVEKKQGRWFWGQIGRGEGVRREGAKAVRRVDWRRVEFGEGEKGAYEVALGRLGVEARGPSQRLEDVK